MSRKCNRNSSEVWSLFDMNLWGNTCSLLSVHPTAVVLHYNAATSNSSLKCSICRHHLAAIYYHSNKSHLFKSWPWLMATRPRDTAIIATLSLLVFAHYKQNAHNEGSLSKAIKQHSPDWTRWGHTLDEQEFGAQSIKKKQQQKNGRQRTNRERMVTQPHPELISCLNHSLFIWSTLCWSESNFPPPLLNMLHLCLPI